MEYTCGVPSNEQAEDRAKWASSAKELIDKVVGGKYRVEKILGRGGMGTIYVAEQQPLGRKVALKVLHPTLGDGESDPEFAKRFLLEAATLSKLAHPNIVVVHDYGALTDAHASCFMVMELLDGKTINQVLTDEKRFDAVRALRVAREIARALRAAHDLGVIHRDLKPSNAMLVKGTEGEIVKVLDFGLVKVLRDDSEELTAEGRFLGSPRYMSPEQIQRLPMDGRADLYSLGVILYRMLCGEVPFAGEHAVQTLMAHLAQPVPRMEDRTGIKVHPAVEQIVMTLLEKDPNKRYANAEVLIRQIDSVWPLLSPDPLSISGEHAMMMRASGEYDPPSLVTPPSGQIRYTFPGGVTGTGPTPVIPPPEMVSAPPAAPQKSNRWLLPTIVVLAVGFGVIGAAAATTLLGGGDPPVNEVVIRAPEPAEPEPVIASPPPEVVPQPEAPVATTFTLNVRSDPPGATLYRDGAAIGETPISIELDPATLETPAIFSLRMRGHAPITFEQGPSTGDVTIDRQLPRLASRPRQPPPDEPRRGGDLSIKTAR
jgi:serine/threonine protein kinase